MDEFFLPNLALPPAGTVPDWVHLVPAGTSSGKDGRGPYILRDPQGVINASLAHGAIPFDENHSTLLAVTTGGEAPARGWVDQLEMRADGIWGHVDWNESGRALLTGKNYRWHSPVLELAEDGKTITAISSVALTNNPNLINHLTAMQSKLSADARDKLKPTLFAVPGKKALPIEDADHVKLAWDMVDRTEGLTASERAEARRRIIARAKELGVNTSGWAAQSQSEGHMERVAICAVLGIADATDDNAVMTALADLRAENVRLRQEAQTAVPLARHTELQSQFDGLQAERKQEKAIAFIDAAIKEGKPIASARGEYIALHVANPEHAEKIVKALPSINAAIDPYGKQGKTEPQAGGAGDDELTPEDRAVCARMGIKPEDMIKSRKEKNNGAHR